MTKNEQIDEIFGVIDLWACNAVRKRQGGASVYNPYNAKDLSVALYDAGCRKTPDDIRELIDVLAEGANLKEKLNKIKRLEEENERLKEVNRQLNADYNRSLERLKSNCREIGELNAEVRELKAELNARLTCDFVKTAQKQAQIDVLNRLKSSSIYDDNYLDGYVFIDDINKLLEELNK